MTNYESVKALSFFSSQAPGNVKPYDQHLVICFIIRDVEIKSKGKFSHHSFRICDDEAGSTTL